MPSIPQTKSQKTVNKVNYTLLLSLLILEILILCICTFSQSLQGDENEHLYNSYMIYLNKIPYKDFFEHHNPLLWYILSPLYFFLENNHFIYYVARSFMLINILLTSVIVYKITKLFNIEKFFCYCSAIIYLSFPIIQIVGIQIRPDTPMALLTTVGIYNVLKYLKNKEITNLSYSFLFFCLAFWTLQKAVILILPIAVYFIYLFIKKKITLKNLLSAVFYPTILSIIYIGYLYFNHSLDAYFIYNYTSNMIFSKSSPWHKIICLKYYQDPIILSGLLLSILIIVYAFIKKEKKLLFYSSFVISSILLNIHMGNALNDHYWLPVLPLIAVIFAICLSCVVKTNFLKFLIMILFLFQQIPLTKQTNNLLHSISLAKYISQQTTTKDIILTDTGTASIKQQAEGYYFFGPREIIEIAHNLLPYQKILTIEQIILTQKPKLIHLEEKDLEWTRLPEYLEKSRRENLQMFLKENYIKTNIYISSKPFYIRRY